MLSKVVRTVWLEYGHVEPGYLPSCGLHGPCVYYSVAGRIWVAVLVGMSVLCT
jgi:hypothetical protein